MRNETPRRAKALFESGYYCAESVFLAMAEALGVDCKAIPRLATGLCSGIARSCGTCGAVLGAILAVGLALGRDRAEDSVEPAYTAVNAVTEAFLARYGSTNCHELTASSVPRRDRRGSSRSGSARRAASTSRRRQGSPSTRSRGRRAGRDRVRVRASVGRGGDPRASSGLRSAN